MQSKTALISIHPEHVAKILSGEKRLEFRRVWATHPLDRLLIYSTTPTKRLVAVANIKQTIIASPNALWLASQTIGGGITRQQLFEYLEGKQTAFALELSKVNVLGDGFYPSIIFGHGFRAPQSFRYLRENEERKLNKLVGK
jgi:predicted transcriptional regulator